MTSNDGFDERSDARDSYLALNGDDFRRVTESIRQVTDDPFREVALRAAYLEISLAIVEDGGPPADNHAMGGRRTRMSSRLFKALSKELEHAGLLECTDANLWMTPTAKKEIERRAARRSRRRLADESPATGRRNAGENSENRSAIKGGRSPTLTHTQTLEESSLTPLPPTTDAEPPEARSSEIKRLASQGLGKGGVVSPEARRKVAARYGLATADPLVRLYEAWPRSLTADDPDGLFIASAPRFWRDATPEVRAACRGGSVAVAPAAAPAATDGPTETELEANADAVRKSAEMRRRPVAAPPKREARYVRPVA